MLKLFYQAPHLKRDNKNARQIKRKLCQKRSAIEPVIGHLKHDSGLLNFSLFTIKDDKFIAPLILRFFSNFSGISSLSTFKKQAKGSEGDKINLFMVVCA